MCGIAGEIRFDGRPASIPTVNKMTKALQRRGPDNIGVSAHGNVALGHRRLQIIDLTQRGRQPMEDPALGLTVVFNGCIYNHKQLRAELERSGYRFFSTSDTEVLLKAYHAWGEDCVKRLNGMFAFVIHERDKERVFLARDRLGIKPLYYTKTSQRFRFASALPALLKVGRKDTEIDPVSLNHYMTFHSVVPAPRTLFKQFKKLPPATTMILEADGTVRTSTYWKPDYRRNGVALDEREWEDRVEGALRAAVERRLVADVPVGVLLSGGLDSSLIVGLLAEHGASDLSTFSIGFEDRGGEPGNEFEYSDVVAEHFRTKHHKISVDSSTLLDYLPDCVTSMSEPMVSHDNIGFYLLSKKVSENIKVVQSGQGADEIFGGYDWYPPLLTSEHAVSDYARVFFDRTWAEYQSVVEDDLLDKDHSLDFVTEHFARPGAEEAIDQAMRLDTTVMLVDDPVKRVDNMTMAWGVEARVPFLDHEVVELAAQCPPDLKVKNGGKYILKSVARKFIPAKVIDRPKGYFPVPALKYLNGRTLEYVRDVLHSKQARERGLFRNGYVSQMLAEPTKHITPLKGSKLWQIALLESWLQTQGA